MSIAAVRAKTAPAAVQKYNSEAEQAILSLAFRDPDLLLDNLSDKDFFMGDHALIARAIRELSDNGLACDPVTVANQISQIANKDLFDYLSDLYSISPPAENADSYIVIVAEHAYSRRMDEAALRIQQISGESIDAAGKRQMIESIMQGLDESLPVRHEALSAGDGARLMAQMVENMSTDESVSIMTGFDPVDQIVNGMLPGDMIVLAGRPGMGKTAFALAIGENIAQNDGRGVAVFSMEMSAAQLAGRMVCSIASIDSKKLRRGNLTSQEQERFLKTTEHLDNLPLRIDDRPNLSVPEIRASLRRMKKSGLEVGLIVIDYLQLMKGEGDSRYEQVTSLSTGIKSLAKEMGVPVIVLSQLSRDVERRADKRPMPSDLRESGAIEQDADVIMMLYRDEVYYPDTPNRGEVEVLVPKNRAGSPGTAILSFEGKYTRFATKPFIDQEEQYVELD